MVEWETTKMIWALSPFAMIVDFFFIRLVCWLVWRCLRYMCIRDMCVLCTFSLLKWIFSFYFISLLLLLLVLFYSSLARFNFNIIKYFYKLYFIAADSICCHFLLFRYYIIIIYIITFGDAMCRHFSLWYRTLCGHAICWMCVHVW